MKSIIKVAILLLSLMAQEGFAAESQKQITFEGQTGDTFDLQNTKVETRYRNEEVDSTCTRQIPYTTNECGYETRYRQECRWVPGRQDCRTEYDRVCRNVTRYRQECRRGRSRQQCTTKPGGNVCRRVNGEMRCRTRPPRRVCTTVPGERTCRRVPYTDRQCNSVPRRRCSQIPGQNICEQIPYQEHVCRDVTRYREEQYACRRTVQVPYRFNKKVNAQISATYSDQTEGANATFNYLLTSQGKIQLTGTDQSENSTIILLTKNIEENDHGDELDLVGHFHIDFLNKDMILAPALKPFKNVRLSKNTLSFKIGKVMFPKNLNLKIKITRKTILGNTKQPMYETFNGEEVELINENDSEYTLVKINLPSHGVKLKKKKKYKVEITTEVKFENENVLNPENVEAKKGQTFKIKI